MRAFRSSLILCLALALSACGFHLRGAVTLPYQSLYIALGQNSILGTDLRRQIEANQPGLLVEDAKQAEAVFRPISSDRDRIIAAMSSQGRTREYQLRLRYSFRVEDAKGQALTPVQEIILTREVTYDDNLVLSKAQEEDFLWQDMEKDLAQQILRRLAFRPKSLPAEPETR